MFLPSLLLLLPLISAQANTTAPAKPGKPTPLATVPGAILSCTTPKTFALTFDDGPSEYTDTLLDILAANNITATFFLLGNRVADPTMRPTLARIARAGHMIGVHTWDHPHLYNITDPAVIRSQIKRTDMALRQSPLHVSPWYFRAPYGEYSPLVLKIIQEEYKYELVQWNFDSSDWRYMDVAELGAWVYARFSRLLGSVNATQPISYISLQHDILDFSVNQTADIIAAIKQKGFRFSTVADCVSGHKPWYRDEDDYLDAPGGVKGTNKGKSGKLEVKDEDIYASRAQQLERGVLLVLVVMVGLFI
jgi:peptidoglycan/xylan/chitin deacetylase (PgdA/CDA1 family)